MRKCFFCELPWRGYGTAPRPRETCRGCGKPLHCCVNCHHFDHAVTSSCKLPDTTFIGSRSALNYCEAFRMADKLRREAELRVENARNRWEALFRP